MSHVECFGRLAGWRPQQRKERQKLICSVKVLGAQALAGFQNKIYSFNKTDKVFLTFIR